MEKFRIEVLEPVLTDLQNRLTGSRWPDEIEGSGWDYGSNREYLQELVQYWLHGYNWRAQEAQLNALPQFTAEVQSSKLHFVYVQGRGPTPTPLLLTHGWPDSFYRFVKLIPLLTDPEQFGGRAEDAFTVVVPDIPGFGFSEKPKRPGVDTRVTATLFARLMTEVLGYSKFLAHGGDFGASVSEQLGLYHPEVLLGLHLNNVPPQHAQNAKLEEVWSEREKAYLLAGQAWEKSEGAFTHLQTTKPQTLSFGLNDSPVGLLAWIVEKFRSWSDCGGNPERAFSKDELLTNVMIYWVTQTISSSTRYYYEKAHRPAVQEPTYVTAPTGIAVFAKDILPAPREFAERFFNVRHWSEISRGGHFAALEEPELLAQDLRKFGRLLR